MNEFTVLVTSVSGGEFRSQVTDSPIRLKPEHRFSAPLPEGEVAQLLAYRSAYVKALGEGVELPGAIPGLGQEEVGERLAGALLGGEVGDHFRNCLATSDRLRLRLVFDPKDEETPYLASLPWELIYDAAKDQFWGRREKTPLVRDLTVDHGLKPLKVALPLRILILHGEDAEGELDLAGEAEVIGEAWADLIEEGLVEIDTTTDLGEMRSKLRDGHFHILHYLGHGAYDASHGLGAVFVDPPVRGTTQVEGSLFAEFLQDVDSLRLVFLNTCHGGRYSGGLECKAVASLAGGVLQRTGVSVLAMQHKISDTAALKFSSDVYRRLAKKDPLDVAVSEARLNLARHGQEWAIPVLYLSSRDGKLFELEERSEAAPDEDKERPAGGAGERTVAAADQARPAVRPPEVVARPSATRVLVRSMVPQEGRPDFAVGLEEHADEVIDLRGSFDGRYIREDHLWQDEVLPKLTRELSRFTRPGQALHLDFAAHLSVSFASGWILESKSGLNVAVGQPSRGAGFNVWTPEDGSEEGLPDPLWQPRPDLLLDGRSGDVALAVSATHEIAEEVHAYVVDKNLPVGRILDLAPAGGAGDAAVRGGGHALCLAQALSLRGQRRRPHERSGKVHLFAAMPSALSFYLGQLSRVWGGVVVYEYAFGAGQSFSRYHPSLELPPPGTAEPPRHW